MTGDKRRKCWLDHSSQRYYYYYYYYYHCCLAANGICRRLTSDSQATRRQLAGNSQATRKSRWQDAIGKTIHCTCWVNFCGSTRRKSHSIIIIIITVIIFSPSKSLKSVNSYHWIALSFLVLRYCSEFVFGELQFSRFSLPLGLWKFVAFHFLPIRNAKKSSLFTLSPDTFQRSSPNCGSCSTRLARQSQQLATGELRPDQAKV